MKAFRFPLQTVLAYRGNQEDRAREAFMRAQTELQQIMEKRQAIEQEIELHFAQRREALAVAASSEQLQQMQQGLRALQERMRQCQSELQKKQSVADEKWKTLLEARQKREALEKLQEKQKAHHDLEASRAEQNLADEMALLKPATGFAAKWR